MDDYWEFKLFYFCDISEHDYYDISKGFPRQENESLEQRKLRFSKIYNEYKTWAT